MKMILLVRTINNCNIEVIVINTQIFDSRSLILTKNMIKKFFRKLLKKDKMIVRKTDNELIRYIKQTNIIEERKRYEELMKLEEEKRKKGLNDSEKREIYFN